MSQVDITPLKSALQLTMNPNQASISQGEQILAQFSQQSNYPVSLIIIIDDSQNDLQLRQSAVVNLKSYIDKNWKNNMSPSDKSVIKGTIVDALIRCSSETKLRKQYEDIIYKLITLDYPTSWSNLLPNLYDKLVASKNFQEAYGTLLALKRLVETFQFQIDEDRKPLEQIVTYTFPQLEKLTQSFLENYNEQSGTLISVILKIFYQAVYLQIPYYLQNIQIFQTWMTFIKLILSCQVPSQYTASTIDEAQITLNEKTHYWQNKKWASRIMNRLIQKLFIKQAVPRELLQFSQSVSSTYATSFMESFYQLLANSSQSFVAPKTCIFALKYLYHAMRLKSTAKILNPHLDKLLFDITIPKMTVTTRDDRIWKEDPEEYVRMQEDSSMSSFSIKNAAKDLFECICQENDQNGVNYLTHYFQYCHSYFQSGVDPRTNQQLDPLKKEALLWGLQIVAKSVIKSETLNPNIEQFLEYYVLPELKNPIGFIRARACYEFKKKENLQLAVEGIYQCILDNQLPVKVGAAIAFSSILMHDEAKNIIRPGLDKVLQIYLELMEIIDVEDLVLALEEIVLTFQQEITPYAQQLALNLANIFHKYCNKQTQCEDSDDDNENEMASARCLIAIKRILSSPLNEEAYQQLEEIIFPIINYSLTNEGSDFLTECLQLLNTLLYKKKGQLSQGLWFYYPVLTYMHIGLNPSLNVFRCQGLSEEQYKILESCKQDWGDENLKGVIGCIRNYIQKGGDIFLSQNDLFGNSFVMLLFQLIEKLQKKESKDDIDANSITTLLINLIENNRGKIDNLVPEIMNICLQNIQLNKQMRFKIVNLGVISILIWYNCQMSLSLLNEKGALNYYFQMIFELEKQFKYEWDIQRLFLGFCQILQQNVDMIPDFIKQNLQNIGKMLVQFSSRILAMREKEESCELEEQAIEDKIKQSDLLNDDDDEDDDYDEEEEEEEDDACYVYESPLEEIDAILLYEQLLLNLQQKNEQLHACLLGGLNPEEQEAFARNIKEAREQYQEWLNQRQGVH